MTKAPTLRWLLALTALLVAACGGSGQSQASPSAQSLAGQSFEVAAVWTGTEQSDFKQVLDAFKARTGASYTYTSTGDNIGTVLGSRLAQKNPPDVAIVPQPGLLADLAKQNALIELDGTTKSTVSSSYASIWSQLSSYNGKQYGVPWKGANKSTFWYNVKAVKDAGVTSAPGTFADLVKDAKTVSASGTPALAMTGGDGWTLTDWFENVYLSQAGPDKYDQLAKHQIKWTDDSVRQALTTLAQIWGDNTLLAGGRQAATSTGFMDAAPWIVGSPPKAAMIYEADFVQGVLTSTAKATPKTDFDYWPFPAAGSTKSFVVGGGDIAVIMKDTPAAKAFVQYLATPEAPAPWIKAGGFTSPNKKVETSQYPDQIAQASAKQLTSASVVRFDMSDQAPAAFGGTKGKGEWADLQAFLANPTSIDATMQQLEKDAAAAYGS
ncbi:MAG TPA: ABC transporter substrate-binding protein [Candidatus Dormibacteraeota bacterium]|nr:ABC transporter substrate-binding protein [Candidatus Dormibacteraeota bacterium]